MICFSPALHVIADQTSSKSKCNRSGSNRSGITRSQEVLPNISQNTLFVKQLSKDNQSTDDSMNSISSESSL